MANITVKQIEFGNWGACVHITNGEVELVATIDKGPRIIRYGYVGGANLFFEDKTDAITNGGEAFAPVGGGEWHIYGGHRLWTSPEAIPRTTYPDNEPVAWRATEQGVVLTPPAERWNQLQKEIEVSLDAATGGVTVVHCVTNNGPWGAEFAPWALSVMAPGGTAIVPQTTRDAGMLPNRTISIWSYTKMNDERVTWGERYIWLKQSDAQHPFKIGTSNEAGWAGYSLGDTLFVKSFPFDADAKYPDNGVNFEIYTNGYMLELESLGELRTVKPGETVSHTETWKLIRSFELPENRNESELAERLNAILA
ncbi:hypothetical protein [Paenibacillus sp. MBLB4367]|uniref:hypothetical protein n=1 Tax=Paenibacillus sp. MBLB4367 TaxID=3384767 RepID=UPI0039080102